MSVLREKLKEIQLKVGNVGVRKLFLEAKRRKVPGITLDAVKLYLATDESKQLFRPLPESKGKTAAEAQQFRVQMDLIDMKYSPSRFKNKGPQYKYIIVLIDVMSRFVWTAPIINKEPATVEPVLRQIINSMEKKPAFISSDKGAEFTGPVDEMLLEKNIIHRTKEDTHDMNALSLVDRSIQNIKKRLAESLSKEHGEWVERLPIVTKQYNNTQHPTIRGEPAEFNNQGHEVIRFMALADNAEKLKHNQDLLVKRTKKLDNLAGFRVPIGAPKAFQRGFKQRYSSDVHLVKEIKGSVVEAEDGNKIDVKRVLPVHEASDRAEPGFALGDERIQNKKDKLLDVMVLLYASMESGESKSVYSASTELRRQMGEEYKKTLASVGFSGKGGLVKAIRLFDNEFEVDNRGYYFKKL